MRTKQREKDAAITRIAHSAVAEHETDRFSMLLTRGGTLVVDLEATLHGAPRGFPRF
jgi:hypothetical protein